MKTGKMKTVMVALDYDPTAQKVAETGFSLAKSLGAELVLLHVIADSTYYSTVINTPIMGFNYTDIGSLPFDNVEMLKKASEHFLKKSKSHLDDETIQTIVREGDFAETILKAAKDVRADIIVMGSHSRRWLESIIMGSVTEKVLHHTKIPLFIVPTKKHK